MPIDVQTLALQAVGSISLSAALSALIAFVVNNIVAERIRLLIKNEYDEKLESYKVTLKARADIELERLKSALSVSASEHNVQFSHLHEKRAQVIDDTYKALRRALSAVQQYVAVFEPNGIEPRRERYASAGNAYNQVFTISSENRLFFPKSTIDKLDEINQIVKEAIIEFDLFVDQPAGARTEPKKWLEIHNKVTKLSKDGLHDLERDFRRLLGDTSDG